MIWPICYVANHTKYGTCNSGRRCLGTEHWYLSSLKIPLVSLCSILTKLLYFPDICPKHRLLCLHYDIHDFCLNYITGCLYLGLEPYKNYSIKNGGCVKISKSVDKRRKNRQLTECSDRFDVCCIYPTNLWLYIRGQCIKAN